MMGTVAAETVDFDASAEAQQLRHLQGVWANRCAEPPPPLSGSEISNMQALERRLREKGQWVVGPTTMFEVLGLQYDEVRNCRVIRWLLDPLAPHGRGTEALRMVLARASSLAAEQGITAPSFDGPSSATVRVEETRGRTRADVVIEGPSWTVVIEAKINAVEQDGQGRRLSENWPGGTYVYLTRRGGAMASAGEEQWVSMRWRDLLSAIREAFGGPGSLETGSPGAIRARRAAHDYLEGCRRLET